MLLCSCFRQEERSFFEDWEKGVSLVELHKNRICTIAILTLVHYNSEEKGGPCETGLLSLKILS